MALRAEKVPLGRWRIETYRLTIQCMQRASKEEFQITSVHRDDLQKAGFDASKVDNETMDLLARKIGEAYVENAFWVELEVIADDFGIPKHK